MSFDIHWGNLASDARLNKSIKDHLNTYLGSISLPSYVCNLRLLDFNLGKTAPNITLKEISDPLDEIYKGLNEDEPDVVTPSPNDIQFLVEVEYKGDLLVTLAADLVLHYPSENFMVLPVKLTISNVGLHSLCLVAYLSKHLLISFLCDISDADLDNKESLLDPNGHALYPRRSLERISIVRNMKIETEIGQQHSGEGSVLRSVGRLEQFLLEIFKNFLRKEVSWPSWIELDFNDDNEEDQEQSKDIPTTSNTDASTTN